MTYTRLRALDGLIMKSKVNRRMNASGRRASGHFVKLTSTVYRSENFKKLSGSAVKLLIEIALQYRGYNNGDLQASISLMRERGWKSSATLNRARQELLHYGFIEQTRQGGLGKCSLFAITWESVDECDGKLEVRPTRTPSLDFQLTRPTYRYRPICCKR